MPPVGPEGVDVGDVDAVIGLGGRGVEVVGGADEERACTDGGDGAGDGQQADAGCGLLQRWHVDRDSSRD